MSLTPRAPQRPLFWPEHLLDLLDWLGERPAPVWAVGGAVRDAWLGRPIADLDLAVAEGGVKLARAIANHFGGDIYPLDAERDVGRVLLETDAGRLVIDVARLRGPDLETDLRDRDFTMNAMAVALNDDPTLLIDPLGGESDLIGKTLRRCAAHAISGDPVRALRALRLSAQFKVRIEAETLRDVGAAAGLLAGISAERVRDEGFKLLALPRPAGPLRAARRLGLLAALLPVLDLSEADFEARMAVLDRLSDILAAISQTRTDNTAASFGLGMMAIQLDRYRARLAEHLATAWPNGRPHRALLMLALLAGGAAPEGGAHLRLSTAEIARLSLLRDPQGEGPLALPDAEALTLHRYWRRMGEGGIDTCLLTLAARMASYGHAFQQDDWLIGVERVRRVLEAYFDQHARIVAPPMMLDGAALMGELGLAPGRVVGALLDHIREAQVRGEVLTRDDALAAARAYLKQT